MNLSVYIYQANKIYNERLILQALSGAVKILNHMRLFESFYQK